MKKRRPWLAFTLSLIFPGLGQLYNGDIRAPIASLVVSSAFTYLSMVYLFGTLAKLGLALGISLLLSFGFAFHAYFQARRSVPAERKPFQRWWAGLAFAALLYGLPTGYGYLIPERFLTFQIPSESMVPTLLVGDRLVADGWAYREGGPQRGDIVVFDYPRDPTVKFVKRVVGLPGDAVSLAGGELYVNGVPVPRERTAKPADDTFTEFEETLGEVKHRIQRARPAMFPEFGPAVVPPGNYFVMGDNRDRSSDSRVWSFLPREKIVGRMSYIYFSWDAEAGGMRWDRIGAQVK